MKTMQTLYAERLTENAGTYKGLKKTVLRDKNGNVVGTYPAGISQPSKLAKTIVFNCWKYNLKWIN